MRERSWIVTTALAAVFALAMTACSDVEEEPPADTGGAATGGTETGTAEPAVAQCGGETIVIAVNPWVGAAANANVAKNIMESEMGCTVELQEVNESAQFPAMADGDVDATLEVWPSGHAKDRKDYIDKAGTVVDGGLLGIIGNIGWFTPSYVIEENPQFATWEGFEGDTGIFATAETGDKGRFLGADTTYSIFDEAIIATLSLNLEVVYSGSEAASLAALDKAYSNGDAILMYWWTPQWANAKYDLVEVELPPYTDECGAIAAEDPDAAVGYGCDYAEDVLYKAFSAELETKDPAAFAFLSSFNWTDVDQNQVALQIQEGTDPSEAAQSWIDANTDVWQAWLPTA
jgi:glycine betaine/proline transport system substrate-binding protein